MIRTLAVALAVAAAVLTLAAPAQSGDFEDIATRCSSVQVAQQTVDQRVAELSETGKSDWLIRDLSITNPGAAGVTFKGHVVIDDDVPCAILRSTVNHEWAHLQQDRMYSGRAAQAYGGPDQVERVAGCVAFLFGAPDWPAAPGRCTSHELDQARDLINILYVVS